MPPIKLQQSIQSHDTSQQLFAPSRQPSAWAASNEPYSVHLGHLRPTWWSFLTNSMNSDGEWMMDLTYLTWFNWGPTCWIALLLRLFERQLELLVGIQWHSVFLFVSDAGCTEDLEESCRTRSRPPNPMTSRPLGSLLHCKVKLFQLQRLHLHVFLHQLLQWHPKWGSICHDRNDLELLIGTTTQFANCKHQYWPTLLSTLKLRLHQSPKQPFPRPDLTVCLEGNHQPSFRFTGQDWARKEASAFLRLGKDRESGLPEIDRIWLNFHQLNPDSFRGSWKMRWCQGVREKVEN